MTGTATTSGVLVGGADLNKSQSADTLVQSPPSTRRPSYASSGSSGALRTLFRGDSNTSDTAQRPEIVKKVSSRDPFPCSYRCFADYKPPVTISENQPPIESGTLQDVRGNPPRDQAGKSGEKAEDKEEKGKGHKLERLGSKFGKVFGMGGSEKGEK